MASRCKESLGLKWTKNLIFSYSNIQARIPINSRLQIVKTIKNNMKSHRIPIKSVFSWCFARHVMRLGSVLEDALYLDLRPLFLGQQQLTTLADL
jgi:hypothetical protein